MVALSFGLNGGNWNTKQRNHKLVVVILRSSTSSMISKFQSIFFLLTVISLGSYAQNTTEGDLKVENEVSEYDVANSEYFMIEAAKYQMLEDYEKAIVHLDKALELDKDNDAVIFKKSEILSIQGEFEKAKETIEKAITLDQKNLYYYVLAAQINQSLNDPKEVASIYQLMVKYTDGWERYGEQIIDAYVETNQNKEALALMDELFQVYPNYPELYLKKAELEIKENKPQASLNTLAVAYTKFEEDDLVFRAYIDALVTNEDFVKVETILNNRSINNHKARILYLDFLMTQGRNEAIEPLVIANFNDETADLETKVLSIGYLFSAQDEASMKIDSLQQKLIDNYPEQPLVYENGAYVYNQLAQRTVGEERQRLFKKAISSYKMAATLDPNNFETWIKVFDYEIAQAQWNELLEDVEYLLDLYPNQAILYYYYAEAYRGLSDLEEANTLTDQGLRMSGRNELLKSLLYSEKAKILAEKGQNDQADDFFNQALNTDNIDERAIYEYAVWLNTVNPAASIELMEGFSNAISGGAEWVKVKMSAFVAMEELKKARKTAEEYIESEPTLNDGALFELYGDVLFQLGENELALVQWEKALTLGGFSEKLEEKIANKSIN